MIHTRSLLPIIGLFALMGLRCVYGQDNVVIWKEFVAAVKNGKMTADMVWPYEGLSKDVLLKFLADFKGGHDKFNSWKEWDNPEVFAVGNQVHYIVTFTEGDRQKAISVLRYSRRAAAGTSDMSRTSSSAWTG